MVLPSGENDGDAASCPLTSTVAGPRLRVVRQKLAVVSSAVCGWPLVQTMATWRSSAQTAGCKQSSAGSVSRVPGLPGRAWYQTWEGTFDWSSIENTVYIRPPPRSGTGLTSPPECSVGQL